MKQAFCIDAEVTVNDSPEGFAGQAADAVLASIWRAPGPLRLISLSGGNTPFPVYRLLPAKLAKAGLAENCYWLQTDERLVAADDERSNQKAIRASLFADGLLPESHFYPVPSSRQAAAENRVADAYQKQLLGLPEQLRPPAPLDLIILGIGNDGHTASLFPKTDWQKESMHDFAVFEPASQPEARISMTYQRILQAREVLFLVSGGAKQPVVDEIFFNRECEYPAAVIARQRPTRWVLDASAISPHLRMLL
ncbi:MAG: 6-phosphogluconolactonase, eukaryotic type [Candidatus Rifleibacterium amylolyticum]|nr:MAG: 6-phosphogluconolactonase, eukaryotic type [Candidatus Rifleibacterium amylolyticum]